MASSMLAFLNRDLHQRLTPQNSIEISTYEGPASISRTLLEVSLSLLATTAPAVPAKAYHEQRKITKLRMPLPPTTMKS